MKKIESSLLNMMLVLTGVAVIMGGILAYMHYLTDEPIKAQEKLALTQGIKQVMQADSIDIVVADEPDTVIIEKDSVKTFYYPIYVVKTPDGQELGAAVRDTVNGFGGPLVVLVGFDHEGTILGYTLLKHTETPGLGAKAEDWFKKGKKGDIVGKQPTADSLLTVTKQKPVNSKEVQAITASTITSRAFLLAVNNAYLNFLKFKGGACCKEQKADCAKPCCQKANAEKEVEPTKEEEKQ